MSESYTPKQLHEIVNSQNPEGPKYDPYGSEALYTQLRKIQVEGGDIIAAAEQEIEEASNPLLGQTAVERQIDLITKELETHDAAIGSAINSDELQQLLDNKNQLIRELFRLRALVVQERIEDVSTQVQNSIKDASEIAESTLSDANDLRILNQALQSAQNGRKWSEITANIRTYASSPDAALKMREALDLRILNQALQSAQNGRKWSEITANIRTYASSPDAALKMREALDLIILNQALQSAQNGLKWSEITANIRTYASSPDAALKMREMLT